MRLVSFLDGAIFPCSRAEILICADENEAPDHVLNVIESLPDQQYRGVREIISHSKREPDLTN